jgi:hypothetical protein
MIIAVYELCEDLRVSLKLNDEIILNSSLNNRRIHLNKAHEKSIKSFFKYQLFFSNLLLIFTSSNDISNS